jgi:hypothetical protein
MKAKLKQDLTLQTIVINNTPYHVTPLLDYTDYFGSTCGHIISRVSGEPRVLKGMDCRGYLKVRLRQTSALEAVNKSIHRLIVKAFYEEPDADYSGNIRSQVNHIDGDKTNNRMANLEQVSPVENIQHLYQVLKAIDVQQAQANKAKALQHDK